MCIARCGWRTIDVTIGLSSLGVNSQSSRSSIDGISTCQFSEAFVLLVAWSIDVAQTCVAVVASFVVFAARIAEAVAHIGNLCLDVILEMSFRF
jgi:hypothetical protein